MAIFDRDAQGKLLPPPGPVASEKLVLGPKQLHRVVNAALANAGDFMKSARGPKGAR